MQRDALLISAFVTVAALGAGAVVFADADTTDGERAETDLEIVDRNDELNESEHEMIRNLVSNDDAMGELRARLDDPGAVTLEVVGVAPDGRVHMDASAPGESSEVAVTVAPSEATVEVETVTLMGESDAENGTRGADQR
ncbi:hypothetical protein [Halorussus amylolyticus]|uniref:hypothetical protein n=1 Tax=Halorussus amylolyticus TaxID=1126242 RepID=UPI001045C673|nr:hypothetical protein [Halorussus amylolyticus]